MPTETIRITADTIDGAAEQIIRLLEGGTDNPREVIYFDGWLGWGASAVLKAVVKQLRSSSTSMSHSGTARDLGKIIHVDVSQWQSKRALQRVIVEELELPPQVMALFDQHDEEDDFDGVEQSARGVIPYVKAAIFNELLARNFLVVFHNGSGSYIDLWDAGVPVMGQLSRKVLWTSRGRFWHPNKDGHATDLMPTKVESAKLSDTAIFPPPTFLRGINELSAIQVVRYALNAEAEEVAKYTCVSELSMSPKIVIECVLYMALLRSNDHNIDWASHGSNYWVCDGIIQGGTDGGRSAWEISDALQRNMSLDFCSHCTEIICRLLSGQQKRCIDRWVSVTNKNSTEVQLTSQATSFFWTVGGPSVDHNISHRVLEARMFEHSNRKTNLNLRVIHLSHCTFSFSSPPFVSCSNLRFLLLDHCKNNEAQDLGEEKECHHPSHCSHKDGGACFRNLWVLEVSYTDWYWLLSKDMLDLMAELRELNVKGVGNQSMSHVHRCSGPGRNNRRVIKLRVVAADSSEDDLLKNKHQSSVDKKVSSPVVASSFPDLSSWHFLKTVALDGCGDLELIDCNVLPQQSLESFTLISSVTTSSKIKRISFQGCAKLKSVLLNGLFDSLVELDMSGTAIRTLDLTATHAWGLERLFLLGCEKLCFWPQEEEDKDIWLKVLRIDTTTTAYAAWDKEEGKSSKQQEATASDSASTITIGSSSAAEMVCGRTITDSDWYISIRDPRLFRSLASLRYRIGYLQVEISSSTGPAGHRAGQGINTSGGCGSAAHKPGGSSLYADDIIIISTSNGCNSPIPARSDEEAAAALVMRRSNWLWGCPPIEEEDSRHCYISIQDEAQTGLGGGTRQLINNRAITLSPPVVTMDARTLHLHDSLSITCLPGPPVPAAEGGYLNWAQLKWCRLERCPNLEGVVFIVPPDGGTHIFWRLETFWASQLPKARYIWDWSTMFRPHYEAFEFLVFLHLDDCPRLVHVLPLYTSNTNGCRSLETLEIVCCRDLRVIFPSDPQSQQQQEREFPRLKRIHLYDLPKLQRICGHNIRMLAPNLETFKVRGCWGLKRLPAVGRRRRRRRRSRSTPPPPVVDCEDWWDGLEWDGASAGHHPSRYKPIYSSAYYKQQQLRASVLR